MRIQMCIVSLLLLSVPIFGCGGGTVTGPTGSVSGSVKFQGKPVEAGAVIFKGPKGHTGSGKIENGTYSISNAPVGQCKITVLPPSLSSEPDAKDPPKEKPIIGFPPQYRDFQTTPLIFEVKTGKNTFDIDLTIKK